MSGVLSFGALNLPSSLRLAKRIDLEDDREVGSTQEKGGVGGDNYNGENANTKSRQSDRGALGLRIAGNQ